MGGEIHYEYMVHLFFCCLHFMQLANYTEEIRYTQRASSHFNEDMPSYSKDNIQIPSKYIYNNPRMAQLLVLSNCSRHNKDPWKHRRYQTNGIHLTMTCHRRTLWFSRSWCRNQLYIRHQKGLHAAQDVFVSINALLLLLSCQRFILVYIII